MKIAIDIRNIGRRRTGSEVVVRELTKRLVALDRENEYRLLTDTTDAAVLDEVRRVLALEGKRNVRIVSLPARGKFDWAAWHVWRWARRAQPDVYHTEYIVPFFLPRRVRVLTHIHDVSFAAMPGKIGWKDLLFLRLLIPWSLRRAACIIAVSRFTKDEIVRYYRVPAAKIAVIYNGVSADFLTPATPEAIAQARKRYALPAHYIFSLGTMQPRKNIPFLVAAFARVAHRMSDIHLVLAGAQAHHFDRAIKDTIARYPHIMERIHFTGFVAQEDLPALYAGARAFVFSSLYEGFGVPLLEAMTQRTRILASDTPVFREVCGDTVLYADPTRLDDFAEALYTVVMCDAVAQKPLAQAYAQRLALFRWDAAARAMHALCVAPTRCDK